MPARGGGAPRELNKVDLVTIAQEFSPRYEQHGDDLVVIDVRGLERLLGSPRTIAHELRREAADRGALVHVALAGTQMAAIVLALARPGLTIIEPGSEASALAPVSLEILARVFEAIQPNDNDQRRPVLDMPERNGARASGLGVGPQASKKSWAPREVKNADDVFGSALAAFHTWGLRTLGELAALPAADLTARLGRQGIVCQTIARGEDLRPLVPTLAEERFESSQELDWPIADLEPLSFVLTRLLEPLVTRLERHDRGVAVLHVLLHLVTRDLYARRLELAVPLRDVRTLRALALIDLESHPPPASIDVVTVIVDPTPGRVLQHKLFARACPTPDAISTLVARLGALLGQDRIGAPSVVDSYRPGAFAMKPFALDAADQRSPQPSALSSQPFMTSALRRCRQPVPARVAVADGRPVRVTTDRRSYPGGAVLACAGPWRTSGNWWEDRADRAGEAGRAGSACGLSERECASDASVGGAPRALKKGARASGVGPLRRPVLDTREHCGANASGMGVGPAVLPEAESLRSRPRTSEVVPGVGVGPHASKRWSREEWDVALDDGAVYRIFLDGETHGWFIEAIVD